MARVRTVPLALLLLALPILAQQPFSQSWPEGVAESLRGTRRAELYSLRPAHASEGSPDFHGWGILGRAALPEETTRRLLGQLLLGVERRTEPASSECFSPRHGLRVGELDLVICLQCHRVRVYRGRQFLGEMLMTDEAGPDFRAAVERHGLAWDGWLETSRHSWRSSLLEVPALDGFHGGIFGDALRLQRPASRLQPVQVRPLGVAVLTGEDGRSREMAAGHQELKGWSDLVNPLRTYFPGLRVRLDEQAGRLELEGPDDVLAQAEAFLRSSSRPPDPETVIRVTLLRPDAGADRYRQAWERDFGLVLEPEPLPATSLPLRALWSASADLHGAPTRFSMALLGDAAGAALLQVEQPETAPGGDVMASLLRGISWQAR